MTALLDREFGWSEATAKRFMQVATALGSKSLSVSDFTDCQIDALALDMIAAPEEHCRKGKRLDAGAAAANMTPRCSSGRTEMNGYICLAAIGDRGNLCPTTAP